MYVLSLSREGKLWLKAYKHEMQASFLQIEKYLKDMEENDALFAKYSAKLLKMEVNLLDKVKKLRKIGSYYFKQGQ